MYDSKIQENADFIWNFQRYKLVFEYYKAESLPPPLNILSYIFKISIFIRNKFLNNVKNDEGSVRDKFIFDLNF